MHKATIKRCFLSLAVLPLLMSFIATAQTYPTRPVTMIVPSAPAGGTDVVARLFAKELGERIGQTIVVDNRAGAAGNLGAAAFARAPADGYTLLFTGQRPVTIADSISSKLPFSPSKDLVPIAMTHVTAALVVVPAALPVKSIADLSALSRSSPGTLNFGSGGPGSETHLVGQWVKQEANINITHVPYKGSGPALQDLLAGRIHMLVASPGSVGPFVADGRLKAIAVLSPLRLGAFPDVPTAVESGFPQLVYSTWFGLFVRPNTPAAVVKRLEEEAAAIAAAPGYRKQVADTGMQATAEGAESFAKTILKDRAVFSRLIRTLNLTEDIPQ